jgi:hypothetical protein
MLFNQSAMLYLVFLIKENLEHYADLAMQITTEIFATNTATTIELISTMAKLTSAYNSHSVYHSIKHIRNEINTIFLTSYEAVSNLLTWIWIMLAKS